MEAAGSDSSPGAGDHLPHKASWAEILAGTKNQVNTKLDFFDPLVINAKPLVASPEEIRREGSLHWKLTLVGQFVGKRPAFPAVSAIAKRLWAKDGLREVIAQEHGFIFFVFSDEGGISILEKGPWFIAGRFLVLKRWERNLHMSTEATVSKLPVWALLYNVPVELWTAKGLSYMSSALGKPLFADTATMSRRRLNYARVCVEIDAGDSLIEEFDLASGDTEDPCTESIKIKVLYQWKPPKCPHCLVFGHSASNCEVHPSVEVRSSSDIKGKELEQGASTSKQSKGWNRGRWRSRIPEKTSEGRESQLPKENPKMTIQTSNSFQVLNQLTEGASTSMDQTLLDPGQSNKGGGEVFQEGNIQMQINTVGDPVAESDELSNGAEQSLALLCTSVEAHTGIT